MLRPQPQPVLGNARVLWLTTAERPNREGLGLTSHLLDCDRLEYRYVVESDAAEPWVSSLVRRTAHPSGVLELESVDGVEPSSWWVTQESVLGVLDRSYRLAGNAIGGAA